MTTTVINFKILVYYYFKTKKTTQNRQKTLKIQTHPSARQKTNQRSSNATIPGNCNQFTVLQRQTRNTVYALLFRTKIKQFLGNEILFRLRDIKPCNVDG